MKYIKSYHEINEGFIDDAWNWIKSNAHILLPIAEIGSFFIPVIGPFLSMGFGLGDAALYAKEGDKTSAGLTAAFSVLPGIGGVVKAVPGIKQLGKEGMEALGKKVAGKEMGSLTKVEQEVLQDMGKNSTLIKKEVFAELENQAASKFDPRGCALKLVKESLTFSVLNESSCDSAWKMVQFATHDPQTFLKYRELAFTQGPRNEFLEIEKIFSKVGKKGPDGIVFSKEQAVKEIQELNGAAVKKFKDLERYADNNDIPFEEIRFGEHAKDYRNRLNRLDLDLENGMITKEQWSDRVFNLNRNSLDFIADEEARWQGLSRNGMQLRSTWQQIGTGDAALPAARPASHAIPEPPISTKTAPPVAEPAPAAPLNTRPAIAKPKANNFRLYQPEVHDKLLKIEGTAVRAEQKKALADLADSYATAINSEFGNAAAAKKAANLWRGNAKNTMNSFSKGSKEYTELYDLLYNSKWTSSYEKLVS